MVMSKVCVIIVFRLVTFMHACMAGMYFVNFCDGTK